ncbi:MAG: Xaa-Pro peptidase family protein [Desulfobulbaceae bacterium]|nr:Xaa-Pro peptidase family protein [Desulfobulbaceae bacterium]
MTAMKYPQRVLRLQERLKRKKVSGMLVTHPGNRRYLSGYTPGDHSIGESSGMLLIPSRGAPYLLTDSRFSLEAEHEASGFAVRLYDKGLGACLKELLPELGIRSLGFEGDYILYSTYNRLEKMTGKLGIRLVSLGGTIERLRIIKTDEEIEKIRASVLLNEEVFRKIYARIKPGMTEREIALAMDNEMMMSGAESPSFQTIAAFGENAAKPHAVPTDRALKPGDTVLVDMGLVLDGYCSDMSRTFVAGPPGKTFIDRLRIVRRAQQEAINAIRDGAACRDIDRAARRVIRDAGYGDFFGHALGHGVGLEVHEEPRLSSRSRRKLRTGMIVTVEPGIYLPDWGGIRLENMVVVRDNGCEVLNRDATFLDM